MILMEKGHPSHSAALHDLVIRSLPVPFSSRDVFLGIARAAVNHVEDIYADDLAFEIIGSVRAGVFFSDWVRRSAMVSRSRWGTVGNSVAVAFALGNMARHGIAPEDGAQERAEEFAKRGRLKNLSWLVRAYESLPKTNDAGRIEEALRAILIAIQNEGIGH